MKGHVPQPDSTEVPAVGLHPPEHGVVERASIHGNRVTGIEGQHAGPDDVAPLQGHVCDPERALTGLIIKGNQVVDSHDGIFVCSHGGTVDRDERAWRRVCHPTLYVAVHEERYAIEVFSTRDAAERWVAGQDIDRAHTFEIEERVMDVPSGTNLVP